jgi:hypothetical protein
MSSAERLDKNVYVGILFMPSCGTCKDSGQQEGLFRVLCQSLDERRSGGLRLLVWNELFPHSMPRPQILQEDPNLGRRGVEA